MTWDGRLILVVGTLLERQMHRVPGEKTTTWPWMKSNQTSSRLCQVLDRGQVGGREGGRGSHCREGVHRHTTEKKLKHGHCNTQLKPPKNAEEERRRLPFGIQVLPLFLILLTRETAPSVPIHFQGKGRVTQKPQGRGLSPVLGGTQQVSLKATTVLLC